MDQNPGSEHSDSDTDDWGFSSGSEGMATETKVGFVLILVLLGALSFVVYKKWEKSQAALVTISPNIEDSAVDDSEAAIGPEENPFAEPIPTQQQVTSTQHQVAVDFDELAAAQSEPQFAEEPATVQAAQPAQTEWPDSGQEQQFAQAPKQGTDNFFPAQEPEGQHAFAEPQPATWEAQQQPLPQAEPQSTPIDFAQDDMVQQFADAQVPTQQPVPAVEVNPDENSHNPFAEAGAAEPDPFLQQAETQQVEEAQLPQAFIEPAPQEPSGHDPFAQVDVAQSQPPATTVGELEPQPNILQQQIVQQGWDAAAYNAGAHRQESSHIQQHTIAQQQSGLAGEHNHGTSYTGRSPHDHDVTIHVVRPRDTYWKISQTVYGTPRYYAGLARYNRHRIPQPQHMRRGMKVLVPEPEVLVAHYPDLYPASKTDQNANSPGFFADAAGRPAYRVGRKDTLTGIAQRHLGRSSRWIQIYHMNRDRLPNPNGLKVGTVLRLPIDASQVRLVGDAMIAQ